MNEKEDEESLNRIYENLRTKVLNNNQVDF
jgi:hypothetical protein